MTAATFDPRIFVDGYSAPPTPGLYHINIAGAYLANSLEDIDHVSNVIGKTAGRLVWDRTNNRVMRAADSTPGAIWTALNGSGTITPAAGIANPRVTEGGVDFRITEDGNTRTTET